MMLTQRDLAQGYGDQIDLLMSGGFRSRWSQTILRSTFFLSGYTGNAIVTKCAESGHTLSSEDRLGPSV